MTDMTVHSLYNAANLASSNPPAEEVLTAEVQKTLLTTADMLEFSAQGLSILSDPASANKPLGTQVLGFGSVTDRQAASTAWTGGSAVTRFTTEYEFSYFDLVNGTITKTLSSGAGALASGGANGAAYSGHTIRVTFDAGSCQAGDLPQTLDSMAASYEAKYVALGSSYVGQALDDQRGQWKALYEAGKEEAAHSFANLLGKFLDKGAQAAQNKKVYDSVQGLFSAYEAKYRALTTGRGTKDWMQADLYEASLRLKALGAEETLEEDGASGLYGCRELDFAAMSISAYQSAVHSAALGGVGSEARQALRVSMVSMKVETMAARGLIGEEMAELLRTSGENARREMLDAMDGYLAKRREEREDAQAAFPAVDRELFDTVYDAVMKDFHRSEDVMAALLEGAAAARVRLDSLSAAASAQRWIGELGTKGYWDTFDGASYQSGIYAFAVDWQEFLGEIDSSKRDLNALA